MAPYLHTVQPSAESCSHLRGINLSSPNVQTHGDPSGAWFLPRELVRTSASVPKPAKSGARGRPPAGSFECRKRRAYAPVERPLTSSRMTVNDCPPSPARGWAMARPTRIVAVNKSHLVFEMEILRLRSHRGTRSVARFRRSSSREGWRWRHRCAGRKSHGWNAGTW